MKLLRRTVFMAAATWVVTFPAVAFGILAGEQSGTPVAECLQVAKSLGLDGAARDRFLRTCVSSKVRDGAPNPTDIPKDPPAYC